MSVSFAAATLLIGSILSQSGELSVPKELEGTWFAPAFPVAIRLEGTKGTVYLSTSKHANVPVEIEVTRVASGLPNSTIEFTATIPEAMANVVPATGTKEFHGLFRMFGDEVVIALLPKELPFPDSVDLAATPLTVGIRLKKIPPDQAAEFERVRGVWRFDVEPGQGGFLGFDRLLIVIGPGVVVVERRGEPRAHGASVILDVEKRQAMCRNYDLEGDEPGEYPLGYSYDDKDRLTLTYGETPFTLVRAKPEDLLPPPDPRNEELDSLAGSWTAVRGWATRRGKDAPMPEVDERWVFAGNKASIESNGEKTEYVVRTTLNSDATLIGLVAPGNPNKIVRFGRYEIVDGTLRIRLHPTIAPDELPIPVEKSASNLRTTLYEFRRSTDADPR